MHARLTLYKRISSARDGDELRELQVEMIDRFGLLPDPAKHLFAIAELKLHATALGIRKLDLGADGRPRAVRRQAQRRPDGGDPADPEAAASIYAMDGPDKLRLKLDLPDAAARVQAARGLLTALQRAA